MTVKQECWLISIILALGRLRQRLAWATITKVQASYRVKPYLKRETEEKKKQLKLKKKISQYLTGHPLPLCLVRKIARKKKSDKYLTSPKKTTDNQDLNKIS